MKPASIVELLSYVTTAVEESMDGTSGAIYSIFVNALVHYFKQDAPPHSEVSVAVWANALQHALNALTKYTAARKGDRTLMDVLIPFIETLSSSSDLQQAAEAAEKGAQRTKFLMPNLGRSVYIGSQEDWLGKIPDPGAWGLSKFLNGLATS
jgi:triose/dihydroxyacetone kinase / FAD-AMP lyase (cyclizing)